MSIITYVNRDKNETGQTMACSAIATCLAVEHNYRVVLISTDFDDKTLENCFWNPFEKSISPFAVKTGDISGGMEGLIRAVASNHISGDVVKSFAKPVLKERLDVIPAPKTADFKTYQNQSIYFSQIADVAKEAYDIVFVDLSRKVPIEHQEKLLQMSTIVLAGLNQNITSLDRFQKLKMTDDFFRRNNVMISLGMYNGQSKYTRKNVARFLKEKNEPFVVPYNILFSDACSEGKMLDYLLQARSITFKDSNEYYFYQTVKQMTDEMDYKRQEIEYKHQ
jgi:cellulose biosynthesis protein BcsQ